MPEVAYQPRRAIRQNEPVSGRQLTDEEDRQKLALWRASQYQPPPKTALRPQIRVETNPLKAAINVGDLFLRAMSRLNEEVAQPLAGTKMMSPSLIPDPFELLGAKPKAFDKPDVQQVYKQHGARAAWDYYQENYGTPLGRFAGETISDPINLLGGPLKGLARGAAKAIAPRAPAIAKGLSGIAKADELLSRAMGAPIEGLIKGGGLAYRHTPLVKKLSEESRRGKLSLYEDALHSAVDEAKALELDLGVASQRRGAPDITGKYPNIPRQQTFASTITPRMSDVNRPMLEKEMSAINRYSDLLEENRLMVADALQEVKTANPGLVLPPITKSSDLLTILEPYVQTSKYNEIVDAVERWGKRGKDFLSDNPLDLVSDRLIDDQAKKLGIKSPGSVEQLYLTGVGAWKEFALTSLVYPAKNFIGMLVMAGLDAPMVARAVGAGLGKTGKQLYGVTRDSLGIPGTAQERIRNAVKNLATFLDKGNIEHSSLIQHAEQGFESPVPQGVLPGISQALLIDPAVGLKQGETAFGKFHPVIRAGIGAGLGVMAGGDEYGVEGAGTGALLGLSGHRLVQVIRLLSAIMEENARATSWLIGKKGVIDKELPGFLDDILRRTEVGVPASAPMKGGQTFGSRRARRQAQSSVLPTQPAGQPAPAILPPPSATEQAFTRARWDKIRNPGLQRGMYLEEGTPPPPGATPPPPVTPTSPETIQSAGIARVKALLDTPQKIEDILRSQGFTQAKPEELDLMATAFVQDKPFLQLQRFVNRLQSTKRNLTLASRDAWFYNYVKKYGEEPSGEAWVGFMERNQQRETNASRLYDAAAKLRESPKAVPVAPVTQAVVEAIPPVLEEAPQAAAAIPAAPSIAMQATPLPGAAPPPPLIPPIQPPITTGSIPSSNIGDSIRKQLEATQGYFGSKKLAEILRAGGYQESEIVEAQRRWMNVLARGDEVGKKLSDSRNFDYRKTDNLEEWSRYIAPFLIWPKRMYPAFGMLMAEHPGTLMALNRLRNISAEDTKGLTGRFANSVSTGAFGERIARIVLSRPGKAYTDIPSSFLPFSGMSPSYGDETPVGDIRRTISDAGFGLFPWVDYPLSVAGAYGERPYPSVFRHSGLLEAAFGNNPETPLREGVALLQRALTGSAPSPDIIPSLVRKRILEKSVEETGKPQQPEYSRAIADPSSRIYKEALADVRKERGRRAAINFGSPLYFQYLPQTEERVRQAQANLTPLARNEQGDISVADRAAFAAAKAQQPLAETYGRQTPPIDTSVLWSRLRAYQLLAPSKRPQFLRDRDIGGWLRRYLEWAGGGSGSREDVARFIQETSR